MDPVVNPGFPRGRGANLLCDHFSQKTAKNEELMTQSPLRPPPKDPPLRSTIQFFQKPDFAFYKHYNTYKMPNYPIPFHIMPVIHNTKFVPTR